MSPSTRRGILIVLFLTLAGAVPLRAQTIESSGDDTTLEQIIIFGRHSIRASTSAPSALDQFSADPYPDFVGVPVGHLTPHGRDAARLLGSYFHEYLVHEGLLTGTAATDLGRAYFRANSIQRSFITAAMFGTGLIPGATPPVHSFSLGTPDPVFDPIAAHVATADPDRAMRDVEGIYGSAAAVTSAYSGELSLIHDVLYPPGTQPTPGASQGSVDPTSQPFSFAALSPITIAGGSIALGGLLSTTTANDPFVMQYADGFALQDVAWGRLSLDALSQQTRLGVLEIAIEMRLPYVDQVQSSNAASHVLRTMQQIVSRRRLRGAFGDARSPVVVVVSSDFYVAGLAGLLGVHWTLPGYQTDFCAPGGALVFELRKSKRSGKHVVRVFYTAQTFDQLRNLTPLTLQEPPATMQLAIPDGGSAATEVGFGAFRKLMRRAISRRYVEKPGKERPPTVLQGVPLE